MPRARIPVHTLALGIAIPLCDHGCVGGESVKNMETVPSIFSYKVPSGKGPSSILVIQQWANGDRNVTMLSRIPPGKIHLFLSHILLSTYHYLSWLFFCIFVSPVTSEFPTGREWAISIFHSPRGLTQRPINILELGRVVTEHTRCFSEEKPLQGAAGFITLGDYILSGLWTGVKMETWWVSSRLGACLAHQRPRHPACISVCEMRHWTLPSLVLWEQTAWPNNPEKKG